VLQVQDTIASNISEGLRLRLSNDLKRSLASHGTENAEAYELLLKGRSLLALDTEEDDSAARDLFRRAIEKDPKFVEAHLEVAATFVRSAGNLYAPPTDAWARADEEIKKVLALDPQNFRARVNRAVRSFMFDWDWPRADEEFRQLSADSRLFLSNAYHPVAIYYWVRGRPDESVSVMDRALLVDPQNLESQVMRADLLAQAGRLDDAIRQYTAIAAAAPEDSRAHYGLAEILKRRGDIRGAIDALRKAYELSGESAGTEALARARDEEGYEAAEVAVARARLADLEGLEKTRYVSPLDIARLHAQVGNREEAFTSLSLALAERSAGLVHLKADRAWDRIRDDPRFAALVRRIGIP
jgi:tetratricopeptide (TPR) repeat protein